MSCHMAQNDTVLKTQKALSMRAKGEPYSNCLLDFTFILKRSLVARDNESHENLKIDLYFPLELQACTSAF